MTRPDAAHWSAFDLDAVRTRIVNRADRLARLVGLDAPANIIANEKLILDEAYAEWAQRMEAAGTPATPSFE